MENTQMYPLMGMINKESILSCLKDAHRGMSLWVVGYPIKHRGGYSVTLTEG